MNELQTNQFAQAFAAAYKAASSTPSGVPGHGLGGTFSYPGLDRMVFNAMLLPHLGLQRALPLVVSNETNPLYGIMTGVTATGGSQPSGVCDDFKTAGLMKLCMHSAVFGRFGLDTTTVQIDSVGEITNRGEQIDLQMVGYPNLEGGSTSVPNIPPSGNPLRDEAAKRLFEFGASWAREYAHLIYDGDPTNNTAGGGYEEYYGLQTLVNTGYRDAVNGAACPAADSIVHDFSNQSITNASADIVGLIQDTFFRLRHIASRAGLPGTRWIMVMPLGMFYRLSEVWAYYYITRALDALTFDTSVQINLGGDQVTNMRDEMRGNLQTRTGQFLMVDGQRIDVILDDALPETEVTPGVFSSDIYILPLTTLNGAQRTLFMNAFNYDSANGAQQSAMDLARRFAPGDSYYTTDAGTFIWHKKPPSNWCVQLGALTRQRIILRTPYLASRIQNVSWTPITEHERSSFTDSAYFKDGGNTQQHTPFPSFYSPTS